jgi:hypothetical protein
VLGVTAGARGAVEDKQLVRVGGIVQYQAAASDPLHDVFGRLDLPDDATAVTLAGSRALVRLIDSTEIDIGALSRVRLAAFNGLADGPPNVVRLELGAIHFQVRHAAGARSNYRFVTPTSQLAVRGTEGYIVTGPLGTDIYCVACDAGDATVTIGTRTFPLTTGWQTIVTGTDPATAQVDVIHEPCGNPAAIAISDGKLGAAIPPDKRVDTTGALGGDPRRPVPLP